jgi:hypothetical protein
MPERLVDVIRNKNVAHTFPITIGGKSAIVQDADYEKKASEAAACAQLVPDAELKNLTMRMHVDRRGPLEPFGDTLDVDSETKAAINGDIRQRAYFLWMEAGRPEDCANYFWNEARQKQLQERAYILWQQEGSPHGRAEEFWQRTCAFEAL